MKSLIVSNVTKCNAATFTNLPHEICPPTPCKKNSICYENTATVFFSRARPGTRTPRENFFRREFFSTPPPGTPCHQPICHKQHTLGAGRTRNSSIPVGVPLAYRGGGVGGLRSSLRSSVRTITRKQSYKCSHKCSHQRELAECNPCVVVRSATWEPTIQRPLVHQEPILRTKIISMGGCLHACSSHQQSSGCPSMVIVQQQ